MLDSGTFTIRIRGSDQVKLFIAQKLQIFPMTVIITIIIIIIIIIRHKET